MTAPQKARGRAAEAIHGMYRLLPSDVRAQHRKSRSIPTIIRAFAAATLLASPSAGADCAPPDTDPQICLTGTVTSSDYRRAIVALPGSPDLERLRPGDTVLDWQLVEIGARYIVLVRDGRQARVELATDALRPAAEQKGVRKQGPMQRPRISEERGDRASSQ